MDPVRDPRYGAFLPLDPRSRISFFRIQRRISVAIFWVKILKFFDNDSNLFKVSVKKFNVFEFCDIDGCSVSSWIRDPGSGREKVQDPGFGINMPDQQHWS